MTKTEIDISAILIYYEKYSYDDPIKLFYNYQRVLESITPNYEIIIVINGEIKDLLSETIELADKEDKVKLVKLGRWFGDATALQVGFENSTGKTILTLPSYQQVDENDIPKILAALNEADVAIGRRNPRIDSKLNIIQSRVFHKIISAFTGFEFNDLKCTMRAMSRQVLDKIYMYGDQDRFLPLFALRYGFKVKEVNVRQYKKDLRQNFYPVGNYITRILEILSIFFLLKFTKKPLRFFGTLGLIIFLMGFAVGGFLLFERFFFNESMADRPMLLLSILLMIFGFQSFAIGLVGELIIFTHARELKDYVIEKIVRKEKPNEEINIETYEK